MVAFIDPRASTTNIVQAVGRALRIPQNSGKTMGYVVIPVIRDVGEDTAAAIAESSYQKIGQVLDALSQYDSTLDEILREERRDRGRRGGLIGGRLRERIVMVGFEDIDENVLYNDTAVQLVESLVANVWEIWGRIERVLEQYPDLNGWIGQTFGDRDVVRDVAAFNMRYRTGTMPEPLLQAAQNAGYRFESPSGQRGSPSGTERRPRLTFEERVTLLEEAIRVNGSVNIDDQNQTFMWLDFTFPGNQERFAKQDGRQWVRWPVGRTLKNLRMAAAGKGSGRLTETQIEILEALIDDEGNHLRILPARE
jgi:hypothetical protein